MHHLEDSKLVLWPADGMLEKRSGQAEEIALGDKPRSMRGEKQLDGMSEHLGLYSQVLAQDLGLY